MGGRERGSTEALRWRAFGISKEGAAAGDYEDAFAVSGDAGAGVPFRAALADGATESVFARHWAQLLADGFASDGAAIFAEKRPAAQAAWADAVDDPSGALPWYTAAKVADGAFATLLGLSLRPGERAWQAASVGDGNLFHLREGALRRAWPRDDAEGDAFVLATDAAAAWLLRTGPAAALDWATHDAFSEAVRHARSEGLLENDDTTVAVVHIK
ncbi:MAG: hypothetical protein BRD48_02920 [Bacteroidetes bacterium QS_9_68_14]|nr:MAG: hypothetical protein BRD48_02920 [Bacteroidetes bacterium QS_9_68_14]